MSAASSRNRLPQPHQISSSINFFTRVASIPLNPPIIRATSVGSVAKRQLSTGFSAENNQDRRKRLARRAKRVNLSIPAELADALLAYLELLALWNSKINLTALDDP